MMTTTDKAILGRAVRRLDDLGMDAESTAILLADDDATLTIALYRAIGELGGRPGWEPAGRALDEAVRMMHERTIPAADFARALFGAAR